MKTIDHYRFDDKMSELKELLFKELDNNPEQAEGILKALKGGRIDGMVYYSPYSNCGCFYGTLEILKGTDPDTILGFLEDHEWTILENWFFRIKLGDNPEDNEYSAQSVEWIEEWLAKNNRNVNTDA